MRKLLFFFILMNLCLGVSVRAEQIRRSLELELEEVAGVKGYEVQVVRILKDKTRKSPLLFKLKSNKWNANLVPGKYELSVRSIDARGVPGDWGAPQEFVVKIPSPYLRTPLVGETLSSKEEKSEDIKFKWEPVPGAEFYKIKVTDAADKVVDERRTKDTDIKIPLAVAKVYHWQVTPMFEETLEGDASLNQSFDLFAAKLEKPGKKAIDDFNTAVISWKPSGFAEKYNYVLEKKDQNGNWAPYDEKSIPKSSRKYQAPLETGEYRVKIKALAEHRQDSEPLIQEFKTQKYDRSPAAIEQIRSESAYETKSLWFAVASYYVSVINYSGVGADSGKNATYSAIGGTGRLGAGYWFGENSPWGVQAVVDISGFTIGTKNYTYLASTLNGVYRYRLGSLGQLRATLGLNYKDIPVTLADPNDLTNTSFTQSKMTTVGPIIGVTLAHGFTRKIGFQINTSLSPSIAALSTPNGMGNVSQMSYSAGLLGSLKLSDGLVGFLGYAYRLDAGAYKSSATAFSPGQNTVQISGHYLNLMLEYGF